MMNKLCTVVCGSSGLIGRNIVRSLLAKGIPVVAVDRSSFPDFGDEQLYEFQTDIFDPDFKEKFLAFVAEHSLQVNGWVNSIYPATEDDGTYIYTDDVNNTGVENVRLHLGGYYELCKLAVELFLGNPDGGAIVNLSSIYGILGPDFSMYEGTEMINEAPYAAAKGGIQGLTRFIATVYGKDNIRANCISPGGVANQQAEPFVKAYCKKVPLQRMAQPDDISGPVLFLLFPEAKYITGQNLVVDGGYSVM